MAIGGVIVEGGRFDWEALGQVPDPDRTLCRLSRHRLRRGVRPARLHHARPHRGRARLRLLHGAAERVLPAAGPRDAAAAHRAARRERAQGHRLPKSNPAVERIASPELPDHPDHALAKKLLPKGTGSIFCFDIKGGREAGRRFIERLKLFSHLANVGDAKSLVIHPASTTHAQLDAAALKAAGIGEGMIRLSVGLEDPDDLLDDLGQALRASQKG